MKAVYVISTPDRIINKMFKIGRTTQNQDELRRRYKTALIDPIILSYFPVENEIEAENNLHKALEQFRIQNSEWFQCDLSLIMNQICLLPMGKTEHQADDYDKKEYYSKIILWLTKETPIGEIIITSKNPLRGFYRPRINHVVQNFWVPILDEIEEDGRKILYKLLESCIRRVPGFWKKQVSNNYSAIDLIQNTRIRSLYRNQLLFYKVSSVFLEECIEAIINQCSKQIQLSTAFEHNFQIMFLEPNTNYVAKYIMLDQLQALKSFEVKPLELTKNIVYFKNYNIVYPRFDRRIYNKFCKLMQFWVPDENSLEIFREFGRKTIMNFTKGDVLFQKSSSHIGKFENKTNIENLTVEYCTDNTLVTEYLFTLLNFFLPGSVVRLFGEEASSWDNVRKSCQDLDVNKTFYSLRMLLIYSSNLPWENTSGYYSMTTKITQWYDAETTETKKVSNRVNYVIVRPTHFFDHFALKTNYLPSANEKEVYNFLQDDEINFKNLTSPENLWYGLYWFLTASK